MVNDLTANPNYVDIDVTSYAANQADVRFKWNYIGDYDFWWQVDDISVFEPFTVDGEVIDVLSTPIGCQLGSAENVALFIRNAGVDTMFTYTASFNVDGGIATSEVINDTIAAGDTIFYLFNGKANFSAFGPHSLKAWVSVAADGYPGNDTAYFYTKSLSPITITGLNSLTMGFELTNDFDGWSIFDANGDGVSWEFANNVSFPAIPAHTGDYCLRSPSTGLDMDDWLFSRCLHLEVGTNYIIDYWTHLNSDFGDFKTFIGASNDTTSMTQIIATTTQVVGSWVHTINTFSVLSTGTYYLGFHAYVTAGAFPGSQRIDDINLHIVTSVDERNKETYWFDLFPNPAFDNLTIRMNRPYDYATVSIINTLGAVVKTFSAESSTKTIDISSLESGIYTAQVVFDGKVVNKHFTISK